GLIAKKANELGLTRKPWVKTSFAPGSRVIELYMNDSGLLPELEKLGFGIVGFACTTCNGMSGALDPELEKEVLERGIHTTAVLSGNRNFDGRIHPHVKEAFLASPPLVVAYAIAGDRKSTRLNSSHVSSSYAVFCLKKKNKKQRNEVSDCNTVK